MALTVYVKTAHTGGGANALDGIDGNSLVDGDLAFCFVSGVLYHYVLDDDSAETENSPEIIAPDANAGDKRWILQDVMPAGGRYHYIDIPAAAWTQSQTSGAEAKTVELGATYKKSRDVYAFDGASAESIEFDLVMDPAWSRDHLKFRFVWLPASGAVAGEGVVMKLSALALSDDDTVDAAQGTAVEVTDTVTAGADTDEHLSPASGNVTPAGTPAVWDTIHLQLSRDPANASDTMSADLYLVKVILEIKITNAVTPWS